MKWWQRASLVALGIVVGLAVGRFVWSSNTGAEDWHREFCIKTKHAIRKDRLDLESQDDQRRRAAFGRFYESAEMYHDDRSMLMCLEKGELPKMDLACRLDQDWECLARLAREVERKLENRNRD